MGDMDSASLWCMRGVVVAPPWRTCDCTAGSGFGLVMGVDKLLKYLTTMTLYLIRAVVWSGTMQCLRHCVVSLQHVLPRG